MLGYLQKKLKRGFEIVQPLITIGITCFNAGDTIARTVESALKQDWPNFEIIIVDDYSTDNSVETIKAIQKKCKKVRLFYHEKNLGYPSALNTIIKHAQGEYVAFFDDDDDNETDRLTKQYKRLSQFHELRPQAPVLCYTHRRVFIDRKEKYDGFVKAIGYKSPEPHGAMVADFLLWHKKTEGYIWGEFGSCTLMASKKTLLKFGFDPNFRRCAEWDLAVRVALENGYFIAVDEPLVIQHKTPTPDKSGKKPLTYALMLRKKHRKFLQQKHVYLGSILLAYSRFYYFRGKLWISRLCLIFACLSSPTKIMTHKSDKRLG